MERQVTVEEVRSFLSASDRQFVKGGIKVSRVRFKRDEEGNCTDKSPAKGLKPSDKGKGQPSGKKTERREKAVNANVLNFLTKSEVKP